MSFARLAAFTALLSVLSGTAVAQTALQWTGAVSTDWNVAGNWNPSQVPTSADDVTIPSPPTATVFPSILGITVSCHDLSVFGGGTINVNGTSIVEVHGDALFGGTLNSIASPALGLLRLVGVEDALIVSTAPIDATLEIAKTTGVVTMGDNFFNGGFTATNTAVVVASNVTASFGDNSSFTGGSFSSAASTGFLDVPGSLTFSGTTVNGTANILCGLNFTADASFAPTAGEVVLGGFFPHAVNVAGSFFDLTLSRSGVTTLQAGAVAGDLAIGASSGGLVIAAGVTLAVGGDVMITGGSIVSADAAAILDVAGSFNMTGGTIGGAFFAECGGAWISSAGFHPTSGLVVFDGASVQTVSATGSFFHLEAAGVDVRSGPLTVTGDLVASAGQFTVLAGQTVAVQGGATFSGGVPFSASATALLDVAGGVVVSSALPWTFARINAAAGWTASAAAAVLGGTVTFDGTGPQAISGPAAFFDLIIASGAAASADAAVVAQDLTVQSGGLTVLAGGLVTVGGTATFAGGAITSADATAFFDVAGGVDFAGASATAAFNADVGGDFAATIAFAPIAGLVRFDAPVAQSIANSGSFFAVEVQGPGTATFSSVTTTDDFTASGGAVVVEAAKTLAIGGDAVLSGGQVSTAGAAAKFDVAGNVSFQGAGAGFLSLEAGRDVSTDAAFAPTGGTVVFDGGVPQQISGPGVYAAIDVVGGAVTAVGLRATGPVNVSGGLTAGAAFDLDDDFTVAALAAFDDGGFTHCIGGDVAWLGTLTLTGVLKLDGPGAATVQKSGALGSVQVAKSGGGTVALGSACQIAGALDVQTGTTTAGVLNVGGATTIGAAGALVTTGTATFSGDLTLIGALSVGGLVFDGSNASVVATSLPGFVVNKPGATLSLGAVTVAGDLSVTAGTLAATGAWIVTGAVTSPVGTTLAAAGFTHEFRATFLADGVTTSTGIFRFAPPLGSGLFAPPINVRVASGFPDVVVAGAAGRVVAFGGSSPLLNGTLDAVSGIALLSSPTTVAGDVTVAGGSLFVTAATGLQQNLVQTSGSSTFTASTTVADDATFSGGSFVATAALDVADDVVFNGATATGAAEIRVGGDWTSGPLFNPNIGTVTFDGVLPQSLFGVPTMPRITIAAGAVVSSAAAVRAKVAATILGSFASTGSLDSDGPFTVAAGGAFDLGAGTHRFGASFFAAAGTLSHLPGARVVFDGATPAAPSAVDVLPDVEAAKSGGTTLVLADIAVDGDLLLTSGRLSTGAGVGATGDLLASGGVLTAADPNVPIVVQGGVVFSGATAESPAIEAAGDFTSDAAFLPLGGKIGLFGPNTRQIFGAGTFGEADLVLRDGQTTATGSIHVDGHFTVLAPALFDASANTHFFGGDFLCLGQLGPDGAYQFEATVDQTVVSTAALPALNVNKSGGATLRTGDATTAPTLTAANLFMSFGRLVVATNTTLAVQTDAVLNAGVFETEAGAVLDVDGAASFVNVVATNAAEIRVGGAFTAGSGFEPASGAVTCDGSALQAIVVAASAASLRDLVVAAGATVDGQSPSGLLVLGTTVVHGVLQSAFASSFRGPVIVSATGSFDGGDASYDFGDDVLVFGQMIHVAQILADGTTAAQIGGTTPLPPIVAAKSAPGSLQLGGTLPFATSSLSVLAGFVFVPASTTALVAGPANFSGGSFASENASAILDVRGDVLLAGCTVAGTASLDVGGAFTADPDFAPTSGRVLFNGPAGTSAAPSTAGGALTFSGLVAAAGTLSLATDATIQAASIEVFSGAALRVAGATATFGPTTFSIAGEVFIDAGGVLRLDDAAPLVVPVGASLRLAGDAGSPAVLSGVGPAGFSVRVEGALAARNFRLSGPAPQGFVIDVTATIAAPPDDFRGGLLDTPRAGGVLLDVRRAHPSAAATTFAYLDFEDANGAVGAANVRAPFGTPIAIVNFGGSFGGESFDDDAAGRITWSAGAQTAVAGFVATPGASVVTLAWATSVEVDAAAFVIERREPPANVFTFIGELPANISPAGAGQGYQLSDTTPASGLSYEYRLSQRFTHGAVATLATTNAQTLLLQAGAANAFGVGQGRTFATPQDAVDAAVLLGVPRPIVRLAPGTYPAFEIGATPPGGLRIVGEGPGVFIDASSAPLRVHGLGFGGSVELRDLVIDAGGATEAALVVENCAAPVVVDGCILIGANGPGARVTGTVGVAFQRTTAFGAPGLKIENGAAGSVAGGSSTDVSITMVSKLRTVGATLGTVTTDPSSAHVAYSGAAALLDAPAASLIGGVCGVGISAAPSLPWVLLASAGLGYTPPAGIVEMPVLLDLASLQILITGTTDVAGADVFPILVPPMPQLVGFSLAFQAVVVDPMAGTVRLSSVASSSIVG